MKKTIIFIASIMMLMTWGCKKEDSIVEEPADTTYSFVDQTDGYGTIVVGMEAKGYELGNEAKDEFFTVRYNFSFREYKGSQMIAQNTAKNLVGWKKVNYTASKETEYVTVMIDVEIKTEKQKQAYQKFINNAFYLNKGGNTNIVLDDTTYLSNIEPKLKE